MGKKTKQTVIVLTKKAANSLIKAIRQSLSDLKAGRFIQAESLDEALGLARNKKKKSGKKK